MPSSTPRRLAAALMASVLAMCVQSPAAHSHVEGPFRATIVTTTVSADTVLNTVTGRLRISNTSQFNRFVVCTLVVHSARHRNITAAEATDGGWHAAGMAGAGDTRLTRFRVNYDFGRRPHHLHLGHCHTPLD